MSDKHYRERRIIDAMVDYRKEYKPLDTGPITVNLDPKALHEALGYPIPRGPQGIPSGVMYREYRVQCRK
jgi:hypothetical protein